MTGKADRLYNLLPAVYRLGDAAQGYPLRALLNVIAEQVNIVQILANKSVGGRRRVAA